MIADLWQQRYGFDAGPVSVGFVVRKADWDMSAPSTPLILYHCHQKDTRTKPGNLPDIALLDIAKHWSEEYCIVAVLSRGLLGHDAVRSAATTAPPP
jgi:hypothetical protein